MSKKEPESVTKESKNVQKEATKASEYFTCSLNDTRGIEKLLSGISLASCTPALEQGLYSAWDPPSGLVLEDIRIGSILTGQVTSMTRSGVYVDVGVGFECFLHKSTLGGQRVVNGTMLKVGVVSIDLEERRITLRMEAILDSEGHKEIELSISKKMICTSCNISFGSREEQVTHYKLDWHRYNLKQRLHSNRPVTEEDFDNLADGISSLSGSESESEETAPVFDDSSSGSDTLFSPRRGRRKPVSLPVQAIGRRERSSSATSTDTEGDERETSPGKSRIQPKVFLRNRSGKVVALYRCVVHGKENFPSNHSDLINMIRSVPSQMKWAILIVGGGHFAAAIFNGAEVVHRKTFHRYTVRAKQGGAQSNRDAKGGTSKSAGASLRRYNEAALLKDVQDLLTTWNEDLKQCSRIFYRAPSFNRVVLFGGKIPPFRKDDPRLRTVPFPTRRATHNEVMRVHTLLSNIECFGEHSHFMDNLPRSPRMHLGSRKPKKAESDGLDGSPVPIPPSQLKGVRPLESEATHRDGKEGREESRGNVSENETTFNLELTEETVNLRDLKEFEVSRKPRKKKGPKRRGSTHKRQEDPNGKERYHFKTSLYGACKSGDVECLLSLIRSLDCPIACKPISPILEDASAKCPSLPPLNDGFHRHRKKEERDVVRRKRHHSGGYVTDDDICADVPQARVPLSGSLDSELGRFLRSEVTRSKKADEEEPVLTMDVLNEAVNDSGTTFLHVASEGGHRDVLRILMDNGADPTTRNKHNQTPYMLAPNKETRNEFRRFWARYPEKYDYAKAQIPNPLTEEAEKEQSEKDAQRKQEKRKVRKEKVKERKAVEHQKKAEDEEKVRFLSLSDREKRALAAEKRLNEELAKRNETAVLSRCFQCATNITGKVPFEYNNNRFCSMQCVKEHRKKPREP